MDTQVTSATQPKADETSVDMATLFNDSQDAKESEAETGDQKPSSPEEAKEPDVEELKAQVAALTKELHRVRKNKTESSREVSDLREQLANVQGQLDAVLRGASKGDEDSNKLAKFTDEQLIQGQTEWEEELLDARDALRKARAENDEAAYAKAAREVQVARATLSAIRKELLERAKRVGAEQAKAHAEANEIVQEIAGLYDRAYEALPDLKDKDSELWKASNAVYNRHPKLMKQLGLLGEFVAVALALTENPKLVPGAGDKKAATVRKELLSEINDRAEKSLIKGGSTTKQKTIPNFEDMPKEQFEAMIQKIKMGVV